MGEHQIGGVVVGVIVFVLLLVAFVPFIANSIANASNQYRCLKTDKSYQSSDLLLCSNMTKYNCLNVKYPTFNATEEYCQNSTGSHQAYTDGFSVYNESSTYVGLSSGEGILMGLVIVVLVVGAMLFAVKGFGLTPKK